MAERKLTVGTVAPGAYTVLPVYESVIARNNSLPAPIAGEIIFITDRRQVKLFTNDGKWV